MYVYKYDLPDVTSTMKNANLKMAISKLTIVVTIENHYILDSTMMHTTTHILSLHSKICVKHIFFFLTLQIKIIGVDKFYGNCVNILYYLKMKIIY